VRLAASLEHGATHPLARAILAHAQALELVALPLEHVRIHPGRGLSGALDGQTIRLGSPSYLAESGVAFDPAALASVHKGGETIVGVGKDTGLVGWIALADELRPDAAAAVATLLERGILVTMLTGDRAGPAAAVATAAGIASWHAGLLPEDKREAIAVMQREGKIVGMVGDGVNDAPALAQADVSFAMGAGAGSALSAADLTLLRNDLAAVATAIDLSQATLSKIRQNLFFAFVYNVLGIPLAAFGLLTPPLAGAAMAASSVSVVANALLLKRWRPPQPKPPSARLLSAASTTPSLSEQYSVKEEIR